MGKVSNINKVELKHYPGLKLLVSLEGVPVEGVVDTGAALSCIDFLFSNSI